MSNLFESGEEEEDTEVDIISDRRFEVDYPEIKPVILNWDGSALGEIDFSITEIDNSDPRNTKVKVNQEWCHCYKYASSIPLIADELKPLFQLEKIGRHFSIIQDRQILLSRKYEKEGNLIEHTGSISQKMEEEIRRSFIFRWVLGLTMNNEKSLWTRTYRSGVTTVTSFRETRVIYEERAIQGSRIPKIILKKWFQNNWEEVIKELQRLFGSIHPSRLRFQIERIIRKIDPEMVTWNAFILDRIYNSIQLPEDET